MSYDRRSKISFTVPISTGTFTASDHVKTVSTVFRQPLARACTLLGGTISVTAAGVSKSPICSILKGTTEALQIPSSHTLGAVSAYTAVTQPGTDFATTDQIMINVISTGTASATEVNPIWEVELDIAEKFS